MEEDKGASHSVREGVRSGILASIREDVEHRGGRTARLLLVAGVIGVIGAIGVTLLVSQHPFGHHPPWHVVVVSTVWAGLLIVSFSLVLLKIRTPALPLARSAMIGILGLGLAGICGAMCPDQHFLHWFGDSSVGASIARASGPATGALCFGMVTTVSFGALSALLLSIESGGPRLANAWLPAGILFVLLLPGVALQSVDTSLAIFFSWLVGTAFGAYVGVAGGILARKHLLPPTHS